jgi:hypothetical protein
MAGIDKAFVTLSFTKKTFSEERKHPYFSTVTGPL